MFVFIKIKKVIIGKLVQYNKVNYNKTDLR